MTHQSEFQENYFLNIQSHHFTNVKTKSITDYDDIHQKFEKWNTHHSELEIDDHRAHYDAKNLN